MTINLRLVQFESVWQDSNKNLAGLQALLKAQQCDAGEVVILPELFNSGFSMQPELFAEAIDGNVSHALSDLAQRYSINIVAGVAQKKTMLVGSEHRQVGFYNSALTFDVSGKQIGHYIKQSLFSYANEEKTYTPGFDSKIVNIAGEPFALFICYDLRFPELFRKIAKQVKGIIVIANWPESRQAHWKALLKARAIENQCFVLGVNRIGLDGNGLKYIGGSYVISPLGEVMAHGGENDQTVMAEINLNEVDEVRKRFPFLEDMNQV